MSTRYADFEFGLVWDEAQGSFDVSLRFTDAGNTDQPLHPKGSVDLDVAALSALEDDDDAYGEALTRSIFGLAEVENFFSHAIAAAAEQPIHFRLHIDGPAEFHALRWELLRDPGTDAPIATSRNVLFSRYLSAGDWRPVPDVPSRELRALIVIAAPTDIQDYRPQGRELAPVQVADELARATTALAHFHPVVLAERGEATLANIARKLNEGFDIVYLVAHGAQPEDVPIVYLERSDGSAHPVDARRLEERFGDLAQRPTLVLLSSCQSAGAGDQRHSDDGGALRALGPRLASVGVAAVIAMQGNVTMTTAAEFARAFFIAFAEDLVVDHAMAIARDAVRDRPDWWVPVLFSRLRSGRIFYEPQFTERAEPTWRILSTMMDTGAFTPVLGPGLADGILGSREEIARRWARRWQMPIVTHVRGNLAQVAQYLKVSHNPAMVPGELQKYLRTELQERTRNARTEDDPFFGLSDELIDRIEPSQGIVEVGRRRRQLDEKDPYRVVAAMPVKVFVTSGWTDLLQEALRDGEPAKKPRTLCFPWTSRVDWDTLASPGDVEPPTVDEPWVFHLCGRLEEPRSLVLTEDDYFDWLSAWITSKDIKELVPPAVKGALTVSSLLFLGYRLEDWDFRVVFQSIKAFGLKDRFHDHVGVQLRPESQVIEREAAQRYLESYFGEDKVNIFWADTGVFLTELVDRTGLKP